MAHGVAVVEDCPRSSIPFVGRHHFGLGRHAGVHHDLQRLRVARAQALHVGDQGQRQLRVQGDRVLDDLGESGQVFILGQGTQGGQVGHHGDGLPEGADRVLGKVRVDAGLAADGGVDHSQESGGDLQEAHPTQPHGGGEARHIPDRAPAQRDHDAGTVQSVLFQAAQEQAQLLEGFGPLAGGQGHRLRMDAGAGQPLREGLAPQRRHVIVGDQDRPRGAELTQAAGSIEERALPDQDRVGAAGGADLYAAHSRRTSATTSGRCREASTRWSASA